jgi:hypothetical protein
MNVYKEERKPYGYWTKEKCKEESLKYSNRKEFKMLSKSAYAIVQSKKSHRVLNISLGGGLGGYKFFWTRERCQEEALKYNNISDFKKFSISSYNVSLKNYWLDELCEHMTEIVKHKGYWTIERCQEDALKYNTRNEFKNKSRSSYGAATKNNWIDDICLMVE